MGGGLVLVLVPGSLATPGPPSSGGKTGTKRTNDPAANTAPPKPCMDGIVIAESG